MNKELKSNSFAKHFAEKFEDSDEKTTVKQAMDDHDRVMTRRSAYMRFIWKTQLYAIHKGETPNP